MAARHGVGVAGGGGGDPIRPRDSAGGSRTTGRLRPRDPPPLTCRLGLKSLSAWRPDWTIGESLPLPRRIRPGGCRTAASRTSAVPGSNSSLAPAPGAPGLRDYVCSPIAPQMLHWPNSATLATACSPMTCHFGCMPRSNWPASDAIQTPSREVASTRTRQVAYRRNPTRS